MKGELADMKLKEVFPEIADRDVTVKPIYRTLDKHGRLYVDVDLAKRPFIVVLVEPIPNDLERFSKEAGGGKHV